MKILIDIGHPAHVHYFRNLIGILSEEGFSFIVTARKKEFSHYLLENYSLPFIDRGQGSNSVVGKLLYTLKADILLLKLCRKQKPDLMLSFGAPYASHVGWILGVPAITMDDTENAKLGQLFYKFFSSLILSPSSFKPNFGSKHEKFNGYMELSYLHPKYFCPDNSVLFDLGVQEGEVFFVLRFVGWLAHHDMGHGGISVAGKQRIVAMLESYGKVFISSEARLPESLQKYLIPTRPEKIHSVLFYSSLFLGESATMASECAVLGTPAIYLDNDGRGYTDEQESKYGMVYNFKESEVDDAINKAKEILENYEAEEWLKKREVLLQDKIDVTEFIIEKIKGYRQNQEVSD